MAFLIRDAIVADAQELGTVSARSWQAAYAQLLSPEHLSRGNDPADRAARFAQLLAAPKTGVSTLVAEGADGAIVGFVGFGPARGMESELATGEIYALYLDPPAWGSGAARELMEEAINRLRADGHERIALWVLADNARARRFYERFGFIESGRPEERKHGAAEQLYRVDTSRS